MKQCGRQSFQIGGKINERKEQTKKEIDKLCGSGGKKKRPRSEIWNDSGQC